MFGRVLGEMRGERKVWELAEWLGEMEGEAVVGAMVPERGNCVRPLKYDRGEGVEAKGRCNG